MAYTPTLQDVAFFRAVYPAFQDVTQWPDARVMVALSIADNETGGRGWGPFLPNTLNFKARGLYAYAAHWLLSDMNMTAAGAMASTPYPASSRSVRDESVSYAVPASTGVVGDDLLGLTPYGAEYLRLRRRAGMGARAV